MEKERNPSFIALIALLVIIVAAVGWCEYYGMPVWLADWLHAPMHQQTAVAPKPDKTGKECVEQQYKLLGSARADSIAKAKSLYLRKSGGQEFIDYVIAHQDGDRGGPHGLATLGKHIEWNFTAKNGEKFHMADKRVVCICHHWESSYKAPLSTTIVLKHAPTVVMERRGDCTVLHFLAQPGDVITWDIDSATGSIPGSACDVQWQGRGAHVPWYDNECGFVCPPDGDVTSGILGHRRINYRRTGKYRATAQDQYISAHNSIQSMVLAICINYVEDGVQRSTNFVYIIPVGTHTPNGNDAVHWSYRVNVPNDKFTVDHD